MISNQVVIAALTVNFRCKTMSVTPYFASTIAGNDNGESREDVAHSAVTQPAGRSQVAPVSRGLESTISSVAQSINHTLWGSLTVKV